MKARPIQVSEEYLETVCEWMIEFANKEDSYTVPQFVQFKGIGYQYIKYFCAINDKVSNTFEIMKSVLHNRWLLLAMRLEELPAHRSKMLMRYLKLYDSHGLDVELEVKSAIAEVETKTNMRVTADNYAAAELQQPYTGIYESNDNKRRGGDKA